MRALRYAPSCRPFLPRGYVVVVNLIGAKWELFGAY